MNDANKDRFEFYKEQFARHSNRIFDYQKDRLRLSILALTGTAAFYAWVSGNDNALMGNLGREWVLLIPIFVNIRGLMYNISISVILRRHTKFLDFIEINVLEISPFGKDSVWKRFKKEKKVSMKPIELATFGFWIIMIFISSAISLTIPCGAEQ
jgi:hypothetical protein